MNRIPHPSDPKWLNAVNNLTPSSITELVIYLLKLQRNAALDAERFSDASIEINSHLIENYALLDTALDLLGIPSDNTVQMAEEHGYPDGLCHDNVYCRDWTTDLFHAMIMKREDYQGFIAAATNPQEWLPNGWSCDDDMEEQIYGEP
ncbi:hypothetical protein ACFPK9_00550 [Rubritalea spongiae]|uniref:DUF5069 domain-containing protein n=1 Tax=Rubritalea spongiae TaxID=430797 RepID=A0ABW5E2N6_9BACT